MTTNNQYALKLITGSSPGRFFPLITGENTIGRHSSNTVCLRNEGAFVSRHHGVLTINASSVTVSDNDSANGLFVNEERTDNTALKEGDIIGFGKKGPRLKLVIVTDGKKELLQISVSGSQKDTNPSRQITTRRDALTEITSGMNVHPDTIEPAQFAEVNSTPDIPELNELSLTSIKSESEDDWQRMPGLFTGKNSYKIPEKTDKIAVSTKTIERYIKNPCIENGAMDDRLTTKEITLLRKFEKVMKKRRQVTVVIIFCLLIFAGIITAYSLQRNNKLVQKILTLSTEVEKTALELDINQKRISMNNESQILLNQKINTYKQQMDSLRRQLPFRLRQQTFTNPVELHLYEIMASFGEHYYNIPPDMVDRVKRYIIKFTPKYRQDDAALFKRWREHFFPYIKTEFEKEHVPLECAYIAIQESLLDTLALSPKGALGLWQFMPETGREYGLRINIDIDDRKEWRISTRAAARHLHDLIAALGGGNGVLFAMAAYNSGKGRVEKAFKKIKDPLGDRNFWHFYEEGSLPEETREYVLQILARIIIDRHGLENDL